MHVGHMVVALRGSVRDSRAAPPDADNDLADRLIDAHWQLLALGRPGFLDAELDLDDPRRLAVRMWMDVGLGDLASPPVTAGVIAMSMALDRIADVELRGVDAELELQPPLADAVEERVAMAWLLYGGEPGAELPCAARIEVAPGSDALGEALAARGGPAFTLLGLNPTARSAGEEGDDPLFAIPREPVFAFDASLPAWDAGAAGWLVEMCLVACQDAGLTGTIEITVRRSA